MILKTLVLAGLLSGLQACGSTEQNSQQQSNSSGSSEQSSSPAQSSPQVQHIDQSSFDSMKQQDGVVVIDVRTDGEVANGYIEGTDLFIDFYQDFQAGIAQLDKNATYLIYCRSGNRSGQAAQIMVNGGFTSVHNLKGGIGRYSGTIVRD